MKGETLGSKIAALRKQKGMTQQELAEPLGVTDKAVSKWERDLSCPDVGTLPKLAQLLDVTVDELMREGNTGNPVQTRQWEQILDLILKAVPLAMGIALTVVSVLKRIWSCLRLPVWRVSDCLASVFITSEKNEKNGVSKLLTPFLELVT